MRVSPLNALIYRSLKSIFFLVALCTTAHTFALKPSHEADRLLMAAEQAFESGNMEQAAGHLTRASQLGITLPADYDFLYGKLLKLQGNSSEARTRLERYVDSQGREGKYYRDALSLITQLEKRIDAAPIRSPKSEKSEIAWSDGNAEYIRKLEKLYGTADATKALTLHVNNLLKFYAYGDERIRAASNLGTPSNHTIRTSSGGELISRNRYGEARQAPIAEDKFSVYGVNPYIDHRCSGVSGNCWLYHPITADRWLQIVGNEDAATEIAKALTNLIRQMQKAG